MELFTRLISPGLLPAWNKITHIKDHLYVVILIRSQTGMPEGADQIEDNVAERAPNSGKRRKSKHDCNRPWDMRQMKSLPWNPPFQHPHLFSLRVERNFRVSPRKHVFAHR